MESFPDCIPGISSTACLCMPLLQYMLLEYLGMKTTIPSHRIIVFLLRTVIRIPAMALLFAQTGNRPHLTEANTIDKAFPHTMILLMLSSSAILVALVWEHRMPLPNRYGNHGLSSKGTMPLALPPSLTNPNKSIGVPVHPHPG